MRNPIQKLCTRIENGKALYGVEKLKYKGKELLFICDNERVLDTRNVISLHSGNDIVSNLIQLVTRSPFNHVDLLTYQDNSKYTRYSTDIEHGVITESIDAISDYLLKNGDVKIIITTPKGGSAEPNMSNKDYESNYMTLLKFILPYNIRKKLKLTENNSYFCSEVVLDILKYKGVLSYNGLISGEFSPGDFFRPEDNENKELFKLLKCDMKFYLVTRVTTDNSKRIQLYRISF